MLRCARSVLKVGNHIHDKDVPRHLCQGGAAPLGIGHEPIPGNLRERRYNTIRKQRPTSMVRRAFRVRRDLHYEALALSFKISFCHIILRGGLAGLAPASHIPPKEYIEPWGFHHDQSKIKNRVGRNRERW